MKFLERFRSANQHAAGYPTTDIVSAKFIKKNGNVVIKNGSNLFRLTSVDFSKISICTRSDGVVDLVGTKGGVEIVLASFGSLKAANSALDRVSAVSAGIGGGIQWWRWSFGVAATYFALNFVLGQAQAGRVEELSAPTLATGKVASRGEPDRQAIIQTNSSSFNPNEPSLEEVERLANGGIYQFKPKIEVPKIEATALSCDPKVSK